MADLSRGFRNNNPGNLRSEGVPWVGLVGHDADGYLQFDSMVHGVRALALNLYNAMSRGRRYTVEQIISHYAPPSENPTSAYIAFVAGYLDVLPDDVLNETYVPQLTDAIIYFENKEHVNASVLASGLTLAHSV